MTQYKCLQHEYKIMKLDSICVLVNYDIFCAVNGLDYFSNSFTLTEPNF